MLSAMVEPMNDVELWQQYCDGDAAAFDRVYAHYRGPLYRYVKRQCNDCPEAEELYQDVWMLIIKGRNNFAGGNLNAWLFRIAHNSLVTHFRKARLDTSELNEDSVDAVDLHPVWPEHLLMLRDCVERFFALLPALSYPQREAFLLKEEGGFSLEQIGEITASQRETVKSRLRYALKRLRLGLADCEEAVK